MNLLSLVFIFFLMATCPVQSLTKFDPPYKNYQEYLNKLKGENIKSNTNLYEIPHFPLWETWLNENEQILAEHSKNKYKSRLVLSIDRNGYISSFDLLDLGEINFNKFKKMIAEINNFRFQKLPEEICTQNLKLVLDTEFMFFERPAINYLSTEDAFIIDKPIDQAKKQAVDDLISAKSIEAELQSPNFIDYPRIGEKIILKTSSSLLEAHVSDITKNKITIDIDTIEKVMIFEKIKFIIKNKHINKKTFSAALLNSGLNTAFQGGFLNAIPSYGIVPGVLAIAGAGGKALQLNELESPFNIYKGDKLILETCRKTN